MLGMRRIPILVIVLVALLAAGCGPAGPANVRIDPALLSLIPPDTVVLAGARLDELRKTPFHDRLTALGSPEGLEQFITDTGLDPRSDLSEVLVAYNGTDGIVMLRGEFNPAELEQRMVEHGGERMPHGGYTVIGLEKQAVLFMDSATALAATPEVLRSLIDQHDEFTGVPAPLLEKLNSIEGGNQIWAVSLGGFMNSPPPEAGNLGNAFKLFQGIQGLTMAANLSRGLVFVARGECASAEDAETLQGALRGLIGFARLGMRKQPSMIGLLDAIAVGRQELVVELRADIAAELLEKVLRELDSEEKV